MDGLLLRRAYPEDAEDICEVFRASVRGLCREYYSAREIEAWARRHRPHHQRFAMDVLGETVFLAEAGDRVVGFASLVNNELSMLYVHPRSGRGAGSLLLRSVETEAAARGIKVLKVTSSLNALQFYLHRGFSRLGATLLRLVPERSLAAVKMEKNLEKTPLRNVAGLDSLREISEEKQCAAVIGLGR